MVLHIQTNINLVCICLNFLLENHMKLELLTLKSKVCGLEQMSRKFRKRIAKTSGMKRWSLRFRKSLLGVHTREHLIAYGLLRNTPYQKIEGKCAQGNEPSVQRIVEIIHSHVPTYERSKWSQKTIESLLKRVAG